MGGVAIPSAHGNPSHGPVEKLEPVRFSRVTKAGRHLWYQLTVIQQPDRARACGSGPKSSADRRPVDPPPVVELRMFEGQHWAEARHKDITFLYSANFFLFATLEHARVMAHGRVQTPAANQPPVLTGVPVSGMAYLDRPVEAGYFLFPDLSVRHEGRYRLVFQLYEETKEERDKDPESAENLQQGGTGESFDYRLEVKSRDFVVWSAKKFPGLKESTQLSRVISEQGCRVRIRRDVRMRRRGDAKPQSDFNEADEVTRGRRTPTPDMPMFDRTRSISGSSERRPFVPDHSPIRRPSAVEYPPHFAQPSSGGHLGFLGSSSSSQYHPQPQPYSQGPPIPPSPSHPRSHSLSNQSVSYGQPAPYSQPPQPHFVERQHAPFRQPSVDYTFTPMQPRSSFSAPLSASSRITLAPINLLTQAHPGPQIIPAALPLPPLNNIVASRQSIATISAPLPHAGSKRSRDETFVPTGDNDDRPYRNGARESAYGSSHSDFPPSFKRADGTMIMAPQFERM